mmetsp:Transcript_125335/g.222215  ORF Transcript_125335/g.222215 Transcript_125335/m.222215 type:complete len:168 (-) Transcript_125335:2-505(-)
METGFACAELRNAREQLRSARTGEAPETITLAAVESLVNSLVEKKVAPLETQIGNLEQQILDMSTKSEAEKKEAEAKIEFLHTRLKEAESTIELLQYRASHTDAKSYAEINNMVHGLSPDWDTSSNASGNRSSPIAISTLFGGLRHYVQALIKRGPSEPEQPESHWV